jgi:hypothetical protein
MTVPAHSIESILAEEGVETEHMRLKREAQLARRREKEHTYPCRQPIPTRAPAGMLDWEIERWWWALLPPAAQHLKREAVLAIRATTRNPHRRGRPIAGSMWNTARDQGEAYGIGRRAVLLLLALPPYMLDWFDSNSGEKGTRK